jgi:hypothetical protein
MDIDDRQRMTKLNGVSFGHQLSTPVTSG